MNPQKVLPDGARCGDFAVARGRGAATGSASRSRPPGGHVDLIAPSSKGRSATRSDPRASAGRAVAIVGGRTHADKGNPCEVDEELR